MENQQLYEVSFWIKLEADPEKEVGEIIDLINKNKGEIIFQDVIKKREMAYPIKKEKIGYFTYIVFKIDKNKIEKINKELLLSKNILRHLIVKRKVLAQKEKKE